MAGFDGTGERRLLLARHGAAGAPPADGGDRERPLSPEGREAVESLAVHLREAALAADHALCSPACRTRETMKILLADQLGAPEPDVAEELYLAPAATLLACLRHVRPAARTVLLVGHNPGLHELVLALAGSTAPPSASGFPPAAIAGFAVSTPWSSLRRGGARLTLFRTP
jgi:phosphohistidine phosphatase